MPVFALAMADMLPKMRAGAVISRPPTNSSGPKFFSSRPMRNCVTGRVETSMDSAGVRSSAIAEAW